VAPGRQSHVHPPPEQSIVQVDPDAPLSVPVVGGCEFDIDCACAVCTMAFAQAPGSAVPAKRVQSMQAVAAYRTAIALIPQSTAATTAPRCATVGGRRAPNPVAMVRTAGSAIRGAGSGTALARPRTGSSRSLRCRRYPLETHHCAWGRSGIAGAGASAGSTSTSRSFPVSSLSLKPRAVAVSPAPRSRRSPGLATCG
jgi:hypothetical protein